MRGNAAPVPGHRTPEGAGAPAGADRDPRGQPGWGDVRCPAPGAVGGALRGELMGWSRVKELATDAQNHAVAALVHGSGPLPRGRRGGSPRGQRTVTLTAHPPEPTPRGRTHQNGPFQGGTQRRAGALTARCAPSPARPSAEPGLLLRAILATSRCPAGDGFGQFSISGFNRVISAAAWSGLRFLGCRKGGNAALSCGSEQGTGEQRAKGR